MDNKNTNLKKEIEKINQRIKEYLWKEWYLIKVKKKQRRNKGLVDEISATIILQSYLYSK